MLYITDGEITDMNETVDRIIEASELPMSIIIIGVGDQDFSRMIELDADEVMLTDSLGRRASRDIVQFVQFDVFKNNPSMLAEEVLKEVPDQIVTYMEKENKPISHLDHIPVQVAIVD